MADSRAQLELLASSPVRLTFSHVSKHHPSSIPTKSSRRIIEACLIIPTQNHHPTCTSNTPYGGLWHLWLAIRRRILTTRTLAWLSLHTLLLRKMGIRSNAGREVGCIHGVPCCCMRCMHIRCSTMEPKSSRLCLNFISIFILADVETQLIAFVSGIVMLLHSYMDMAGEEPTSQLSKSSAC